MHLANEVLQHLLGDIEIGNDAVLQRPDGGDVARSAAKHALGLDAHRLDHLAAVGAGTVADGHYRRLLQHDAASTHRNQRVGRAKVDGQVAGKKPEQFFEHRVGPQKT